MESDRNFKKNLVPPFFFPLFSLNPIRKIHKNTISDFSRWTIFVTTDYIGGSLSPPFYAAFVNINSPYIPEKAGFIIPMNREGDGLQWAGKLRPRLYRWRRYDGGVCERTSVKSGASIMQRGGWLVRNSHPPPDSVVAQPHRSTQGGGNQLDTERKRYVCSRGRDERRKIANWKDQRSNCFMKNHDAVRRVLGILMPG